MFGRPEVDFVKKIANFLETEEWKLATRPLIDFLFIEPDEKGKISLDTVKRISGFLWQKPIQSQRRLVVIDQKSKVHYIHDGYAPGDEKKLKEVLDKLTDAKK